MTPTELEKNMGEIEERLERVRSLYEQYFCGIEKIEPQVPRKDLDRRIALMRKEQIRNTAMRFKFQTLIQRYNTMQQHWSRILREIESGTFRRDLAKAAARFGVDEALTAVGRKRAERLVKGLKEQEAKEGRRQEARAAEARKPAHEEELDEADLEVDDDDDAPTPPPLHRPPLGPAAPGFVPTFPSSSRGIGEATAPLESSRHPNESAPASSQVPPRTTGFFSGFRRPEDPAAPGRVAPPSSGPRPLPASIAPPRVGGAPPPQVQAPQVQASQFQAPQFQAPQFQARQGQGAPRSSFSSAPPPASPSAHPAEAPKPKGGLRLGGGPSKRASQEALSRIADKLEGAGSAENDDTQAAPPVELRARPLGLSAPPPREKPADRAAYSATTAPGFSDARRSAPAPSAPPVPSRPPQPSSAPPGLAPDRLREIYSQYVTSRRERNESTAGITFEKLADSLRVQAEKLQEKHAARKVDYEVIVRDGKTLIKPIVR